MSGANKYLITNTIICNYNNTHIIIPKVHFNDTHNNINFVRLQYPIQLAPYLQKNSQLNCNVDPMIYPLLFPNGEIGWHINMKNPTTGRKITQLQYYQYQHRIAYRHEPFPSLHYSRKLFQQYAVDAWVRVESNRLNYFRTHQNSLKSELYFGLMDHLENETIDPNIRDSGRPFVLTSTFIGGKRHMQQNYQDAMAICAKFGTPDLFLTYTCNPKHTDIFNNLGHDYETCVLPSLPILNTLI